MPISERLTQQHHLVLLRHGESTGNHEGIRQGHADFSLTETGIRQANALAARWQQEQRRFDCIITSPLERARDTARIIADALGTDIELHPEWMERDLGNLNGTKATDLRNPKPFTRSPYDPVGEIGEGQWDLFLRAGAAVQALLRRPAGSYLVVTHGGILNMAINAILGIPPQAGFQGARFALENTGFSEFLYDHTRNQWLVKIINDRSHWSPVAAIDTSGKDLAEQHG